MSWTTSLLLSMFLASKIDLPVGILFTIFSVFVISTKGNVSDLILGYKKKKEDSKYYDIEEYVKYNATNSKLIQFEENLRRKDDLLFLIYKYRFIDHLTFSEMSKRLNGMELARAYEDVSEMASDGAEKQKLMKIAEREKEHYRMAKEILQKHM